MKQQRSIQIESHTSFVQMESEGHLHNSNKRYVWGVFPSEGWVFVDNFCVEGQPFRGAGRMFLFATHLLGISYNFEYLYLFLVSPPALFLG